MSSIPFGHIFLSVKSVSKALRVQVWLATAKATNTMCLWPADCCQTWTRTKITSSRGMRPTIRRSGNIFRLYSFHPPEGCVLLEQASTRMEVYLHPLCERRSRKLCLPLDDLAMCFDCTRHQYNARKRSCPIVPNLSHKSSKSFNHIWIYELNKLPLANTIGNIFIIRKMYDASIWGLFNIEECSDKLPHCKLFLHARKR